MSSENGADRKTESSFRVVSVVISGVFAILAAIAGALVGWWNPNPAPQPVVVVKQDPAPTGVDWEAALASSPVSLRAWQTIAKDTGMAADRRSRFFGQYLGKRVTWQGVVSRTLDRREEEGICLVVMYGDRAELDEVRRASARRQLVPIPAVRCRFPAHLADQVLALTPGTRVVVRGTLADRVMAGSLLATDLYQCEMLQPVAPHTARRDAPPRR